MPQIWLAIFFTDNSFPLPEETTFLFTKPFENRDLGARIGPPESKLRCASFSYTYQLLTWGHLAIWKQSVFFDHKWKIVCRVGTCVCSFCSCKHWLTTHSSKHNIKCTFPLSKNCLGWVVAALLRQVCLGPGGLCSPWCGGPPQQSNHISIFSPYKYEKIQICIYMVFLREG